MPTPLIPHHSPSHRSATLTLYRALLHQIRSLPSNLHPPSLHHHPHLNDPKLLLANLLHNRFHQARHIVSPHLLRPRFEAAYEALDCLDAAVAGDEGVLREIEELLGRCSKTATSPPARKKGNVRSHAARRNATRLATSSSSSSSPFPSPQRGKPSIFDRPLPLSAIKGGRRKVPVLFTANHIPVLRLGKPQPSSLSGYLQARIDRRQRRQDYLHRLDGELEVARGEDLWEDLISRFGGLEGGRNVGRERRDDGEGEGSWTTVLKGEVEIVRERLREEKRGNAEVGRRMQGIVDREREMADREARERGEEPIPEGRRPRRRKTSAGLKGYVPTPAPASAGETTTMPTTEYRPLVRG